MPVTKSAKKKLSQDKKRTALNKKFENLFKELVKKSKKAPSEKNVKEAVSAIDKAAKKNIIHKNKAARLKLSLSKLLVKQKPKRVTKSKKETKKKIVKKKSS